MTAGVDSLDSLAEACRAGAALTEGRPARDLFNDRLDISIRTLIEAADRDKLLLAQGLGDGALLLSRSGELDQAERMLDAADRISRSCVGDAARLARSLLAAQRAYLSYRQGEHREAEALLGLAFECDRLLERAGFDVLIVHRIQLAHNLMRLKQRRGEQAGALLIGLELLHFLERAEVPPAASLPAAWRGDWWDHRRLEAPALVEAMHRQVARELVELFERLWRRDRDRANSALAEFAAAETSQAAQWSRLQLARAHGDEAGRLAHSRRLLAEGPRPSSPLWRHVAGQVAAELEERLLAD